MIVPFVGSGARLAAEAALDVDNVHSPSRFRGRRVWRVVAVASAWIVRPDAPPEMI
jgi:hypothetical protein